MKTTRLEILELLSEMSAAYPEWRFGQTVANISFWALGPKPEAIWDVEDEQFLKALKNHLANLKTPPRDSEK